MSRRCLLALLGLVTARLAAQGVMVAPHAVFMTSRTNSGVVTLYNPNTEAAEVTIATFFGYPETDSLGRLRLHGMPTSDSVGRMVLPPAAADSGQPSAARWIQAFPRRLTVAPRERQTIRLLAAPPPGLRDGEYWVRLVIAVKGGVVPVTGVADTGIKIGLTLEVRTIIGVNYRKGPVQTGVAVRRLHRHRARRTGGLGGPGARAPRLSDRRLLHDGTSAGRAGGRAVARTLLAEAHGGHGPRRPRAVGGAAGAGRP